MTRRRLRKPYRVRRKKSILRNRFFWLGILFILLIGGVFYFICFSQTFKIREIQISGNQKVQRVDLENLIKERLNKKILVFVPANNLLFINTKIIKEEILKKFPKVAEISLKRWWPNKLSLEIKERQPYGIWCNDGGVCFYLDKEGVIFEEVTEIKPDNLIIKNFSGGPDQLGEKVIEENILESISNINKNLRENFQINTEVFSILSPERLNIKTSEGWEIYFNPKEDLNWQLTRLNVVLNEEIPPEKRGNLEYIDLRFSRVYYKYQEGS